MKKRFVLAALAFVAGMTGCSGSPEAPTGAQTEETERVVFNVDPEKPMIALTFDDGPNTGTTVEILDLLEKYHIPASFFLVGDNINEQSAETVKRAYNMGCEIDNHSKTHSDMTKMSEEDIKAEIAFVNDKITEITGEPAKFFRPPYIAVNQTMYDAIDMPFICGSGCNDWDDKVSVERRVKMTLKNAKDGTIILLHDAQGNSKTVEALDRIIPELLNQGYQFVTVEALFKAKGVEISADDGNLYTVVG